MHDTCAKCWEFKRQVQLEDVAATAGDDDFEEVINNKDDQMECSSSGLERNKETDIVNNDLSAILMTTMQQE